MDPIDCTLQSESTTGPAGAGCDGATVRRHAGAFPFLETDPSLPSRLWQQPLAAVARASLYIEMHSYRPRLPPPAGSTGLGFSPRRRSERSNGSGRPVSFMVNVSPVGTAKASSGRAKAERVVAAKLEAGAAKGGAAKWRAELAVGNVVRHRSMVKKITSGLSDVVGTLGVVTLESADGSLTPNVQIELLEEPSAAEAAAFSDQRTSKRTRSPRARRQSFQRKSENRIGTPRLACEVCGEPFGMSQMLTQLVKHAEVACQRCHPYHETIVDGVVANQSAALNDEQERSLSHLMQECGLEASEARQRMSKAGWQLSKAIGTIYLEKHASERAELCRKWAAQLGTACPDCVNDERATGRRCDLHELAWLQSCCPDCPNAAGVAGKGRRCQEHADGRRAELQATSAEQKKKTRRIVAAAAQKLAVACPDCTKGGHGDRCKGHELARLASSCPVCEAGGMGVRCRQHERERMVAFEAAKSEKNRLAAR